MPTYEYECTNCGRVFEMLQSITARPKRMPAEPCAECGQRAPIRRLIGSGGAVLFKGSGFYETDYRSESYKKAAKAEADSAGGGKKDSAKDTKTEKAAAATSPSSTSAKKPAANSDS